MMLASPNDVVPADADTNEKSENKVLGFLAGIDGFEPSKMPESKSGALPLGYIPIFITNGLYHKIQIVSRDFPVNYASK